MRWGCVSLEEINLQFLGIWKSTRKLVEFIDGGHYSCLMKQAWEHGTQRPIHKCNCLQGQKNTIPKKAVKFLRKMVPWLLPVDQLVVAGNVALGAALSTKVLIQRQLLPRKLIE